MAKPEEHTCDKSGFVSLELGGVRDGFEYTTKIYHCSVCGYVTDSNTTTRPVKEN
jgi:hypothetical protein